MPEVRAFSCYIPNAPWGDHETFVVAHSAGKAKVQYWNHVNDAWLDIPYTAGRAKVCMGSIVVQTKEFRHTAAYRGLTFARLGMEVQCGNEKCDIWNGVIVGQNSSANFDVLFSDGPHAGQKLNCHPLHMMKYYAEDGTLIYDSEVNK